MRNYILPLVAFAAMTLAPDSAAQDALWVNPENRYTLPRQVDISGNDSVVFTATQLRIYREGRPYSQNYSALLGMATAADSSDALVFQWPGRAIWKPTTSDNNYNNDYTNPNSQWSFKRSKESEHFIVYWDKNFGDNPNASSVPSNLRVNVDDLLKKAEQFFATNVNRLQMATVGEDKSRLDEYKMIIHLLYDDGWTAVGSGYDDMIGALWVTPSTCHPVGSTIAHETGHCFQYMVATDYRKNGVSNYTQRGWRYGFGNQGSGGNAFWEQCAQWQSFQDYPSETFGYHVDVWKQNYHRHFCHEWMRYASYWLQYAWTEKHGYEAYGKIWRESRYPEDPLETYNRLFCGGDWNAMWDEYWTDYAAKLPNYQFRDVHRYATASAKNFPITMNKSEDGYWQVAYANCPETSGVNIIQLNLPQAGTTVQADFVGLNPGTPLLAADPGHAFTEDGGGKYDLVTTYNTAGQAANRGWRYGFVAIKNDQTLTSQVFSDAEGTATYTVPEGTSRLYFVVVGAPTRYNRHAWDELDANDVQWPYKVRFSNTNRLGEIDVDTEGEPTDTTFTYTVNANGASADYLLGTIDLLSEGLIIPIAEAFKLQPSYIKANTQPVTVNTTSSPKEGKISFAMKQPTGNSYSYTYTANLGFWCRENGAPTSWGSSQVVYLEYHTDTCVLDYGHMPSTGKGKTYVLRPTFVYRKDGKNYYATIELTMKL